MNYIFMGLIFIYSMYLSFIKGFNKDDLEDVHPKTFTNLLRYLLFGTINSFFAGWLFEINWLIWIAFYSVIGIIFCIKFNKEENDFFKKLLVAFLVFLFFCGYRVPTHPASFENYINSKEMYQCVTRWECVKITAEAKEDSSLRAKAEILSIEGYRFDWYFLFAKGSMQLADDKGNIEEFKGINICGFWIEY
ncbi:hypothetical protein ACO1D1_21910 [Neobacillus sp. 19]